MAYWLSVCVLSAGWIGLLALSGLYVRYIGTADNVFLRVWIMNITFVPVTPRLKIISKSKFRRRNQSPVPGVCCVCVTCAIHKGISIVFLLVT